MFSWYSDLQCYIYHGLLQEFHVFVLPVGTALRIVFVGTLHIKSQTLL
jgi:hypothetical protein